MPLMTHNTFRSVRPSFQRSMTNTWGWPGPTSLETINSVNTDGENALLL